MLTVRRVVTWALSLACAAGAVIAIADVDTPLRPVLIPLFLLVVPGVATVRLLSERDILVAASVGTGASIAINVLTAEAMLVLDAWSPKIAVAAIAVLAGLLHVLHILYWGETNMRTNQRAGAR